MCDNENTSLISTGSVDSLKNGLNSSILINSSLICNSNDSNMPSGPVSATISQTTGASSAMTMQPSATSPLTIHIQSSDYMSVSSQELARENNWLREKLKEITTDRDRLLCEVANLRLELDMAELKRLPEDK